MTANFLDAKFLLAIVALAGVLAAARPMLPRPWFIRCAAAGSAAVIGIASVPTLIAVLGITFGWLYPLHLLDRRGGPVDENRRRSRAALTVGLVGVVGLMLLYKAHQTSDVDAIRNAAPLREMAVLVGFSYFLFRAYNFLYVQRVVAIAPAAPSTLLLYLLFPPTLTSGPIQRYTDFEEQLEEPRAITKTDFLGAAYRITRGYFLKICLAGFLTDGLTALLHRSELTAGTSALSIGALYLSSYFDFAGYSDIAIGLGGLMGIRVPENFGSPFRAASVHEFWRNWHITLADWFRDHVYFPLGGIRGKWRGIVLALLVMTLCGIWHGFTWMFLAWGLFHGINLALELLMGTKPVPPHLRHGFVYVSRVVWTNVRVSIAMLMFLPDAGAAFRVLGGLARW